MGWETFQAWLTPAALGALALVVWDDRNRLDKRQTELTAKIDDIHAMMRTELRTMDVRLTRIESHIWPHQPRQ